MENDELLVLSLDQLICDINGSIHIDGMSLEQSLLEEGVLIPLLVEGPNAEGKFFILDGYRRNHIMRRYPMEFESIPCRLYGKETSQENRNSIRLRLKRTNKRMTAIEIQKLVENSENVNDIINELPRITQKRIRRAIVIPKFWRDRVEELRKSQDALAVIWHDLNVSTEYKNELLQRLINTDKIGVDHATALKKMAKFKVYQSLTFDQKQVAVENVLAKAKFTDNEAEMIIIQAIMQTDPDSAYADFWVNYCSFELKHVTSKINNELGSMIRETTLTHLLTARNTVNEVIDGVLERFEQERRSSSKNDGVIVSNEESHIKEKASLLWAAKHEMGINVVKTKVWTAPRIEKTDRGYSVVISG
ncbi:hypothetical protein [Paenibacillus oryzisoli]|uniref:ParB/Sulfiredoxin domain-containing protein n=1 Tax=Paenibacillus oryzisoli TaxID=1850517 RepID=A0A198AK05_9BACL|nr:hypothetical protein [Paenibacillus oryzisoli]OAS21371.1 hypothetical protein A8708_31380 [Paenibacillus oryzisoli]